MRPIGIQTVPLRTPTLPPATHTNTYVVGQGQLSIFDPASPFPEEQRAPIAALDARTNEVVTRIVLTHHHHDHIMGAHVLQETYRERGQRVPIVAHPKPLNSSHMSLPLTHSGPVDKPRIVVELSSLPRIRRVTRRVISCFNPPKTKP